MELPGALYVPAGADVFEASALVEGEPVTPLGHLLVMTDASSGLSSVLDRSTTSFATVDLVVALRRGAGRPVVAVAAGRAEMSSGAGGRPTSVTDIRQDVEQRVRTERSRLLSVLAGLDDQQWDTPSLCAGWTVRDLVVHVLMPYELSVPRFLLVMVRARFDFDRAADRWATSDRRSPAAVLAGLRATEHRRFSVPGAPVEAPLSHLVVHAQDVYRPLGVPSPTDPGNARVALEQLTGPRGRGSLPPGVLDGIAWSATDTDWRFGEGAQVSGPATALLSTLVGRTAALSELTGAGVAEVRARR